MSSESHRRAAGSIELAARFAPLAVIAVLVAGCGTGTYNDHYDHRLADLKQTSKFSVLTQQPTDDLPVNFRVPKVFTSSYELKSEDPHEHGKHVQPQIIMPPFLYSPIGFRRMYEGKNADKKPFYLYVWMYDADRPKDASAGEDAVRNALRFALKDANAKWEDVEADTPDGQTRKWRHLLVKGDQEFEIERSGNLENDRQEGVFDVWLYKTPGWDVMLAWRAPADVWDNFSVGDAKLKDLPVLVAGTIEAPAAGKRNTTPLGAATPTSFIPNIASGGSNVPNGSNEQPPADQATPDQATPDQSNPATVAPQNVRYSSRTYMMGNASDSKLAFSTSFPQEWIERFGVAFLPDSVDDKRRYHDYIAFLRFPPDSRLGKLLSGDILEQVDKGSNVEAGTFEIGGKKGDYRLVRIDFSGNRRSELDGTYIVHFDNETVVIILYGYDDDRDRFKTAIKSLIDNFRIESVAVGGSGPPPPGVASPEPGRTYVGLTSKDSTHPFSFKFPDGWNQQGMSATPLRAEADDSSDTLGLGVEEVPESINSAQLFQGTHLLANFYNNVHLNRTVERTPIQVNGLSGLSIIAEGESPAKSPHRKLIFYVLRKGPMLLTFQGDFDAAKFDASRPQFEQYVNSFRFENPASAANVAAAPASAPAGAEAAASGATGHAVPVPGTSDASKPADTSTPSSQGTRTVEPIFTVGEDGLYHSADLKFSMKFPPRSPIYGDRLNNPPRLCSTDFAIKLDDGTSSNGTLIVGIRSVDDPSLTLKAGVDQVETSDRADKQCTVLERGEIDIGGIHGAYLILSRDQGNKIRMETQYFVLANGRLAIITSVVDKSGYEKAREPLKNLVQTFRFDDTSKSVDASAPTGPASTKPADASAPSGVAAKPADASAPTGPAKAVDPSAPTTGPAAASRPAARPSGVAGADGAVAAPLKAGRVDLEFPEGVTGSIEFPAGFQHTGKSPEASTAPANGAGAVGSADAPETIKIEVKKLGQGVVYNELRKQTMGTDAPNGLAKTLEHGTCKVAASDGEYFVVPVDQSTSPPAGGANAAGRRRMVFIANVQAKHLAVKIIAEVAEANYKPRRDELKACVKSLKFE